MSTGITQHVPRFTSPEGLDLLKPLPRLHRNVGELLAFAHTLRGAGLDLGPRIEKIEQVWDAAQTALNYSVAEQVAAIDLDTVSPDEISTIVTDAALAHVARLRTSYFDAVQESGVQTVLDQFDRSLTQAAGELLREDADRLVGELRKDFTKAAKVIAKAHSLGITRHTTQDELLQNGTQAAIAAYRELPGAVAKLDQIAHLRLEMVRHLGYQVSHANPPHDVTCFITEVEDHMSLSAAESTWEGEVQHVQIDGAMNGSSIYKARVPRLGGAWLELVDRGFTLRLNTATESGAVALMDGVR